MQVMDKICVESRDDLHLGFDIIVMLFIRRDAAYIAIDDWDWPFCRGRKAWMVDYENRQVFRR